MQVSYSKKSETLLPDQYRLHQVIPIKSFQHKQGEEKNAKYRSDIEKENFFKACVLVKADIVNPSAPLDGRYSLWVEFVAVHRMTQNANAPGLQLSNCHRRRSRGCANRFIGDHTSLPNHLTRSTLCLDVDFPT